MKKNAKMKHIIYSDWEAFDLIDDCLFWEDYKLFNDVSDEELDEMSESEKWQAVYDEMECALDDAQCNLNENVGNTIIAIGDLGLWNGRVQGYKEIKGNNISGCLVRDEELCEWWCDAHDFRAKMAHHDGTNYILYRRRKDGISDYQWDNFLYLLYEGKANREHISKYTTSLLPYIAKVYGWKYHGKDVA